MEDKIEVGEYVRTKYGIAKVEKVEVDKPHKTIWYTVDKPQYYCFLVREQEVIKSSKNIIDLIEVGDYVNGNIVYEVLDDEIELLSGKIREKRIHFTTGYLINENEIKSIVTHEQIDQMKYIVKE